MTEGIFRNNDNIYDTKSIENALLNCGVNKGDNVFIHSDISIFGMPVSFQPDIFMGGIYKSFLNVVGDEALIVMPTFSYSFCNNLVFDVQKTKSKVGSLTEWFRNKQYATRTIHPIFSVSISGEKRKIEMIKNVSKDSFDKKSIFGNMHENDFKIIFFGADFDSCTFIHYIEQMFKVPYRYKKDFTGIIRNGDEEYQDTFSYYVRNMDINPILDTTRFELHLRENHLLQEKKLGIGKIISVRMDDLFKEGLKLLHQDINYFLKS